MTTSQRIRPVVKTRVVPVDPVRAFERFTVRIDEWWPLVTHSVEGEGLAEGGRGPGGVGGDPVGPFGGEISKSVRVDFPPIRFEPVSRRSRLDHTGPLADEIFLGLMTLILARWKDSRKLEPPPAE